MKKIIILVACLGLIGLFFIMRGSDESKVELGDYIGIEASFTKVVVTDEDVENALIDVVVADQEDVEIRNRPVRNGDTVNIDYSGRVDGELFTGGTDTDHDLIIGSGDFIAGFEQQIIGMRVGETADIIVTFPENYPSSPELEGAEATFTVKVNSITGKVIPNRITDAMIKEATDDYFSTVEEFKEHIREELEFEAERINNQRKQEAVWQVVLENSTIISLSRKKVTHYSNLFEAEYRSFAEMFGMDLDSFIAELMGMTMADFNALAKEFAEERATEIAIIESIASEQKISISDEEYDSYLEENNISPETEREFRESIRDSMLFQKVMEFIVSKANITAN